MSEENSSLRKQLAEKTDQIEKYEINQQKLQGKHLTLTHNLRTYLLTLTLAGGLFEGRKIEFLGNYVANSTLYLFVFILVFIFTPLIQMKFSKF